MKTGQEEAQELLIQKQIQVHTLANQIFDLLYNEVGKSSEELKASPSKITRMIKIEQETLEILFCIRDEVEKLGK